MFVSLNNLTIDQLEWVRAGVNAGLIVGNFSVWGGVILEGKRFSEAVQAWGWRLLVLGLGAETVMAAALWQVDTTISDKQNAAIVVLGSTIDGFEGYVRSKVAEGNSQVGALRSLVAAQQAQNALALRDLKRGTADLNKARSDALAAAERSQKALTELEAALAAQRALTAKIERLTAARVLTPEQISAMVLALKPFPFSGALIIPEWSSPEVSSIAAQIEEVLDRLKGGGTDDGVMLLPAQNRPGLPSGVSVQFFPGNTAGRLFAAKLVRLLIANGIPASAREEDTGPPDPKAKPLDPNQTALSQIVVYVGLPN